MPPCIHPNRRQTSAYRTAEEKHIAYSQRHRSDHGETPLRPKGGLQVVSGS